MRDTLSEIMTARFGQYPDEFDELPESSRVYCCGIVTWLNRDGTTKIHVIHSTPTYQTLKQMRADWSHAITCGYDQRTVKGYAWRANAPYRPLAD